MDESGGKQMPPDAKSAKTGMVVVGFGIDGFDRTDNRRRTRVCTKNGTSDWIYLSSPHSASEKVRPQDDRNLGHVDRFMSVDHALALGNSDL